MPSREATYALRPPNARVTSAPASSHVDRRDHCTYLLRSFHVGATLSYTLTAGRVRNGNQKWHQRPVARSWVLLTIVHEFSRPIAIDRLPREGVELAVDANADERAALARRLGVDSLGVLHATGSVERRGEDLISVNGKVRADIEQTCVVTLDPVHNHLDFAFERLFSTRPVIEAEEVVVDPEIELPEPLHSAIIDFGEIVAEELALEIDPYPRAPHADEVLEQFATQGEEGPLAALSKLHGPVG
jgi:uncharacterized metal-binding protein YceD (DUF177 family)